MTFPIRIVSQSYVNCFPQSRHTPYVSPIGTPGLLIGVIGRVRCLWWHEKGYSRTSNIMASPYDSLSQVVRITTIKYRRSRISTITK